MSKDEKILNEWAVRLNGQYEESGIEEINQVQAFGKPDDHPGKKNKLGHQLCG